MHFACNLGLLVSYIGLASAGVAQMSKRQTPPTNPTQPGNFNCGGQFGRVNCVNLGNGIDQLPSSGSTTIGGNTCRQLTCVNLPGGDISLNWCNDGAGSVTQTWNQLRLRYGDLGVVCSQSPDNGVMECNGQVFYSDGTNVISSQGCA